MTITMTADEVAVVLAERVIAQAKEDGVCGLWAVTDFSVCWDYSVHYGYQKAKNFGSNTSRREAAEKAVEFVSMLRAKRDANRVPGCTETVEVEYDVLQAVV